VFNPLGNEARGGVEHRPARAEGDRRAPRPEGGDGQRRNFRRRGGGGGGQSVRANASQAV
jgi:hypothetical protein